MITPTILVSDTNCNLPSIHEYRYRWHIYLVHMKNHADSLHQVYSERMHRSECKPLLQQAPLHLPDNSSSCSDTHHPCSNHKGSFDHMTRSRIPFHHPFPAPSLHMYRMYTGLAQPSHTLSQCTAHRAYNRALHCDIRKQHMPLQNNCRRQHNPCCHDIQICIDIAHRSIVPIRNQKMRDILPLDNDWICTNFHPHTLHDFHREDPLVLTNRDDMPAE